jgi:hypothetical protein
VEHFTHIFVLLFFFSFLFYGPLSILGQSAWLRKGVTNTLATVNYLFYRSFSNCRRLMSIFSWKMVSCLWCLQRYLRFNYKYTLVSIFLQTNYCHRAQLRHEFQIFRWVVGHKEFSEWIVIFMSPFSVPFKTKNWNVKVEEEEKVCVSGIFIV